jgi:hypothetical protein
LTSAGSTELKQWSNANDFGGFRLENKNNQV